MADVSVGLGIDMSDIAKALATLPQMSGEAAEKAVRELTRTFDKAYQESKRLGEMTKKNGIGESFDAAGKSAVKFRGILGALSPELAGFAGLIDDSVDAVEGLSVITEISPLVLGMTAAVAAGGLAYEVYTSNVAANEAALAKERAETEQMLGIQRQMTDAVLKLAYVRGELSDKEYSAISAAQKADDLFRARKVALIEVMNVEQETITELRAQLAAHTSSVDGAIARGDVLTATFARQASGIDQVGIGTAATTKAIAEHEDRIRSLALQVGEAVRNENTYAQVLRETDEAQAAVTSGKDANAAATDQLNAGLEALLASWHRYGQELDQVRAISHAAAVAQLDDIAKVDAATADQVAQLRELRDRMVADAAGNEARQLQAVAEEQAAELQVVAAGEAAKASLRAKATADMEAQLEKQRQALQDAADEARRYAEQTIGSVGTVAGAASDLIGSTYDERARTVEALQAQLEDSEAHLTDAQREELESRVQAQKDAAMQAWEAQQAAKLAEAGVLLIAAEMQALASAPPPFNLAAVAAVSALGAADIIAIGTASPPTFHSGSAGDLAPDEYQAVLQRGEPVLSRQARAALGDDTIRAAQAGIRPASGPVPAVLVYRHQGWSRIYQDAARLPGPLHDALTHGERSGLRTGR